MVSKSRTPVSSSYPRRPAPRPAPLTSPGGRGAKRRLAHAEYIYGDARRALDVELTLALERLLERVTGSADRARHRHKTKRCIVRPGIIQSETLPE